MVLSQIMDGSFTAHPFWPKTHQVHKLLVLWYLFFLGGGEGGGVGGGGNAF
jgi:hypothetical protein